MILILLKYGYTSAYVKILNTFNDSGMTATGQCRGHLPAITAH